MLSISCINHIKVYLIPHLVIHFLKFAHLLLAIVTVGSPEIDHDGLLFALVQTHFSTAPFRQGETGRFGPYFRCMGLNIIADGISVTLPSFRFFCLYFFYVTPKSS